MARPALAEDPPFVPALARGLRRFQQFLSAQPIDLSAIKTPKAEAKLARLLKMQFGKKEVTHITYQVAGGEDH